CLDAADAPAQDAEAVFHGGVGVGTDAGIRVCQTIVVEDEAGQVLDVDLVDDAASRMNDAEVGAYLGAPTHVPVQLRVAHVLDLHVLLECVWAAEGLDEDGVLLDPLGWVQCVDPTRVASLLPDGSAHVCQVDNAGDAGEVHHQHA